MRNIIQAQIAIRFKQIYLPSIFGHYTVNSICNLRCSYCYVAQPQIFPEGFSSAGLPIDRAKKVLRSMRRECLGLRIQGGEPLLYPDINELARYAKRDLRFWHVSLITNGLAFVRKPGKFEPLLANLDLITLSIDGSRLREYPREMAQLTEFLPALVQLCRRHHVTLTLNYTADWDDLAHPERISEIIDRYRAFFNSTYIMPVRRAGKTPLPLLRNSIELNRAYSAVAGAFPDYPEKEFPEWYKDHCDPKLKIKVDADGGLVYPCENHSLSAGSLEDHSIRELWTAQRIHYPNASCVGCGKQRFRSRAFRRPLQLAAAGLRLSRK
jgi:MoaA/NifB/PqqE/SkfB family radical SAM enzyme